MELTAETARPRQGPAASPTRDRPATCTRLRTAHGPNGNGARTTAPGPGPRAGRRGLRPKLYGIHNWGQGYFSVNADGHVAVHPTAGPDARST